MARGKYGSAAEARQARESAIAQAQRLERENRELRTVAERTKAEAEEARRRHEAEMARMRADLAAGAEPKLLEAQAKIAELEAEATELKLDLGYLEKTSQKTADTYAEHLRVVHGMSLAESMEAMTGIIDMEGVVVIPDGMSPAQAAKLGSEAIKRIRKVRRQ